MAELIAKSALAGQSALTRAGTTLAEAGLARITAIAPFPGQTARVDAALDPLGLAFPAPNRQSVAGDLRLVWTGREQAFLIGAAAPDLAGLAAVTDQSDGWAILTLTGPLARDVLVRLVPLDLRDAAFAVGQTARSGLNHMQMVLTRSAATGYEIMVFRSMARTAWHELSEALDSVAARFDQMA